MKRSAQAKWRGDLKSGRGLVTTESGAVVDLPFSFSTRFEQTPGSNPEELIAAAHASCFSMALSAELGKSGITSRDLQTTAEVSLEKPDGNWKIEKVHLIIRASVKSEDQGKFLLAANQAKDNCPVSKLLKASITLEVKIEELYADESLGFPLDQ